MIYGCPAAKPLALPVCPIKQIRIPVSTVADVTAVARDMPGGSAHEEKG